MSPYEEPQIDSYRGADAGKVFTLKLESLGKELNKKIKNADAKMIFTDWLIDWVITDWLIDWVITDWLIE